jgi:hypothetical protein
MREARSEKARSFPERERREARKRNPKLARKARMRNAKARRDTPLMYIDPRNFQAWKNDKWIFAGHASPKADPLISAIGSFLATPLLFLALKMIDWNIMYAAWVCVEFKNIGIIFVLKDSSSSQHLHLFLIIHQF